VSGAEPARSPCVGGAPHDPRGLALEARIEDEAAALAAAARATFLLRTPAALGLSSGVPS